MDITCWNCKTVTKLDKAAIEAAIAQMDSTKIGFYDVACASCGKSNRTTRDVFDAALKALQTPPPQAPQLTKREVNQQAKEARAEKDKAQKEKAAVKEMVKKAKKKG